MVANRDEFYQRPTARAEWWENHPDLLAGKDLQAGGTWMGVSRSGRIAAITNYREPQNIKINAPSRGALVADYLSGTEDPLDYLNKVAQKGQDYNGFNLVLGGKDKLCYYSNRGGAPIELESGIYGLSNELLDSPWPKVLKAKEKLGYVISAQNSFYETTDLFNVLSDRSQASDDELPSTGVTLELERVLSSMFIISPNYGTRVSTVLTIDDQDQLLFEEKAFVPDGESRKFYFQIVQPSLSQNIT